MDELLLQEIFSLREKVKILAHLLAKYEPELELSGLIHDVGTEDAYGFFEGAKNTEQPIQSDKS